MLIYVLFWFPMLIIAIMNGTLRDLWYRKYVDELAAHQISTVTLVLFFSLYIGFVIDHFPPGSSTQAVRIGVVWAVMTLCFEFGFGTWRGNSWQKLLQDYNIFKGRIWILIPVWIAIAPYIFFKFDG